MSVRSSVEESRERLVALTLLLQSASRERPLSQETIVTELLIDEYPQRGRSPRKVHAYEGSPVAVRQKFERDKVRIRELGWQIETIALPEGGVGYWIDADSVMAPVLHWDDEERRVIQLALRLYGFGASGAFGLFNEGPGADSGLEDTTYLTPILRAVRLHRVVSFDYHSSANRTRVVEPLVIGLFHGAVYLVARVRGSSEVKGYRLARMTSMPQVSEETFEVDEDLAAAARAWRPEFGTTLSPVRAQFTTSENYARLIARQFAGADLHVRSSGEVDVALAFESLRAALRFALRAGDRVRVRGPKVLRRALRDWLEAVNAGPVPEVGEVVFEAPATDSSLGQALRLLHMVHHAPEGVRLSSLAQRSGMAEDVVRHIMDRLVTFEPLHGDYGFPAHVIKECDDWEHEDTQDALYLPEEIVTGTTPLPALTWRDLFEINIALREALAIHDDPVVRAVIDKIEGLAQHWVQMDELVADEVEVQVQEATQSHQRLKIRYGSGTTGETTDRTIEPRQVRFLNGHAYTRAYCLTSLDWRTFRIDRIVAVLASSTADEDRPPDTVTNWLTQVGEVGEDVVVLVQASSRWLFESLPRAQWHALGDGGHLVRLRVANEAFLDQLMVEAGAGAVVVTPRFREAGHAVAARMLAAL